MDENILIIGGYGTVGGMISMHLSKLFPNKVIVAGRNFGKAERLAKELKGRVSPLKFDVLNEENNTVPAHVKLVIMCVDQKNTLFIENCIARGIHYMDITAENIFFEKVQNLHQKALLNNVKVLLSVGLAPGISNLLAQNAMNSLSNCTAVDLYILLGLGEKHGDAAYKWTFENIHSNYTLLTGLVKARIKSFSKPKKTDLLGKRTFYSFNFSDQHILSKTTKVNQVMTRLAFDSRFLTNIIAGLRIAGITKIFKNTIVQNIMLTAFKNISLGSNIFAVKSIATNNDRKNHESILIGHNESSMTAYMTVISVSELLDNPIRGGVFHIHELVSDIPLFLDKLKKYDPSVTIKL